MQIKKTEIIKQSAYLPKETPAGNQSDSSIINTTDSFTSTGNNGLNQENSILRNLNSKVESAGIIFDTKIFEPGEKIWEQNTGDGNAHPFHATDTDGTLYTASGQYTAQYSVSAIDKQGKSKWLTETEFAVTAPPITGPQGNVYACSHRSTIYAFDQYGRARWSFRTGQTINTPIQDPDGTLYVTSHDRGLYAINSDTGDVKWKFEGKKWFFSAPVQDHDGTIYAGNDNGSLYAINPDGSKKWEFHAPPFDGDEDDPASFMSSPCPGVDGTIYAGNHDGKLYAINPDGSKKWEFDAQDSIKSAPIQGKDGKIYFTTYDNRLFAVDPEDGSKKWEFSARSIAEASFVFGSDETSLYVQDTRGKFYSLNVEDGSKKWEMEPLDWKNPRACITPDGTLYAVNEEDRLLALNGDGSKKWEFESDEKILGMPAFGADGNLYVRGERKIYAINIKTHKEQLKEKTENQQSAPVKEESTIVEKEEYVIIGGIKVKKKS